MKLKQIVLVLSILFLTYIGYTFQPSAIPFEGFFANDSVAEPVDYRPEISEFLSNYESFFKAKFDEYNSVGAALAIVYKGQIVLVKPFGVKKVGTQDSIDSHTVFRLASVSKGFSGVLASQLNEKKIIDLNAPVISYLPDFKLQKEENQNTVTIKNLLSHTSGLLSYSFDPVIEDRVTFNRVYNSLNLANIDSKPGERYAYQNVMFSLIDTIAFLKTGKKYETLLQDNIFNPLGMFDASASFQGFTKTNNFAYPHKGIRKGVHSVALNDRYYTTIPAAGINASISDMSKWLQALLGYSPDVINTQVLQAISQPQVNCPLKRRNSSLWGEIQKKEYSLGWRILTIQNKKILYHGGFVEGYRAEIAFCPESQIGMVMLLNSPNLLALEAVPQFVKSYFEYSAKKPKVVENIHQELAVATNKKL